jgi:hypothetical protein
MCLSLKHLEAADTALRNDERDSAGTVPLLIVVTLACSAAVSGRRPAGLFLKPLRRADPSRRDDRPDLFRRRLRHATIMAPVGVARLRVEYSDLCFDGSGLVKDFVVVVS